MTESQRVAMLEPPKGKVSIILDTDTACEVDDQYREILKVLNLAKATESFPRHAAVLPRE